MMLWPRFISTYAIRMEALNWATIKTLQCATSTTRVYLTQCTLSQNCLKSDQEINSQTLPTPLGRARQEFCLMQATHTQWVSSLTTSWTVRRQTVLTGALLYREIFCGTMSETYPRQLISLTTCISLILLSWTLTWNSCTSIAQFRDTPWSTTQILASQDLQGSSASRDGCHSNQVILNWRLWTTSHLTWLSLPLTKYKRWKKR